MINQSLKYAISLGVLVAALNGLFFQNLNGLALLFGILWGSCNVYFISRLLHIVLISQNYVSLFPLLIVKFPFLYWIGYQLLRFEGWNIWFLVAGFPFLFLVMGLNSVLRSFVKVT